MRGLSRPRGNFRKLNSKNCKLKKLTPYERLEKMLTTSVAESLLEKVNLNNYVTLANEYAENASRSPKRLMGLLRKCARNKVA